MKERPILFSAPMIRAILAGQKTQTRRVVKPQPEHPSFGSRKMLALDDEGIDLYLHGGPLLPRAIRCPYGRDGDRLWVREAWTFNPDFPGMASRACYRADPEHQFDGMKWKPSIHMPRAASRITLKITDVRVERLHQISEADAIAEGIEQMLCSVPDTRLWRNYTPDNGWTPRVAIPQNSFRSLWSSINGAESWDANPWVWVVDFERI